MVTENEQKFLDFYDKNVTKIYRYIYFRIGSEEAAQDLSSEAFMKTWQYLRSGNYIGNISAMVYQVCRNLIADYFRYKKSLPISLEEVSDSNLGVSESGLIGKTDAGLDFDVLKRHLASLREEYQELIIWHYIDDFDIEEMAGILGKSEGAVRTSLSRALKALKAAVAGS